MALTARQKTVLRSALANPIEADAIAAAIDGAAPAPSGTGLRHVTAGAEDAASVIAAHVAALGALAGVGVGAVDNQCALKADVDARVTTLQTKIDDITAKLIAAGIMA